MPTETAVVKVVEVGYALDQTAHRCPIVRMVIGYGIMFVCMLLAFRSSIVVSVPGGYIYH